MWSIGGGFCVVMRRRFRVHRRNHTFMCAGAGSDGRIIRFAKGFRQLLGRRR